MKREGYRTAFAVSQEEIEIVVGDMPWDELINFGEGEIPEFPSDILLEELKRERTSAMRDIVRTIQSDQYSLISRPLDACLLIQGGPGTGKTAIGERTWVAPDVQVRKPLA